MGGGVTQASRLNGGLAPSGAVCSVLLLYMFCTDCWLLAAMYTTWLILDWNTPKRGEWTPSDILVPVPSHTGLLVSLLM